jgi:hypothetical protein
LNHARNERNAVDFYGLSCIAQVHETMKHETMKAAQFQVVRNRRVVARDRSGSGLGRFLAFGH